jgi:hypothetical protein
LLGQPVWRLTASMNAFRTTEQQKVSSIVCRIQ